MALSHIPFDDISETHIKELTQAQRAESLYVEYKRQSYGGSDSDHAELLADISSFANAAGGDLIIGVDAPSGIPASIVPFIGDADAEIRRLDAIARSGLEPRIPNLRFRALPLPAVGNLILVRVPRSFLVPYRVNYRGRNRFWARASAGKYEPNVQELRRLFTEAPQLVERIRGFREGRLALIRMGDTPVNLMGGAMLVVHLVPLSAFSLVQEVNLSDLWKQSGDIGPLGRSHPTHWEINFDGFLGLSNADPKKPDASYVQVFRNGAIEGVSHIEAEHNTTLHFHAARIETYCVGSIVRWGRVLAECGVGGLSR